jgi:hypothetical protein
MRQYITCLLLFLFPHTAASTICQTWEVFFVAYVELFNRVGCLEVTVFVMSLAGDKEDAVNGMADEFIPRTSEREV